MNKHKNDQYFQTGRIHFQKANNRRIYINVPDEGDFIIIKIVSLSDSNLEDYSIMKGALNGNRKRGVTTTYLKLSKGAFIALHCLSEDAIDKNFGVFLEHITKKEK